MLKIRLQRVGRKHEPVFRLVIVDSHRSPKSGKFLEILGNYDSRRGEKAEFNSDRIKHWISLGAKVSDTVHNLLVSKGIIEGKKINVLPKKKPIVKEKGDEEKKSEEASTSPASEETPAEESSKEEADAEAPKEEVKKEEVKSEQPEGEKEEKGDEKPQEGEKQKEEGGQEEAKPDAGQTSPENSPKPAEDKVTSSDSEAATPSPETAEEDKK